MTDLKPAAGGREWVFPASYGQERIWLADQVRPGASAYAVVMPIWLPAGVTATTAIRALTIVVDRHQALRTSLRGGDLTTEGEGAGPGLRQVVHEQVPVQVGLDDLRGLPADEVETRFHELCLAQAAIPFDLGRPPLWRARLVRAGDDDRRLVVVAHHTICDGRSWFILDAELRELCRAAGRDQPAQLPEFRIHYPDWAVWQRHQQLTPARVERELAYWRGRLADLPVEPALRPDHPRGQGQSTAGAQVRFELPRPVADQVAVLARRLRVTEFSVLFGAFAALLARLGDQPEVVVGVPVAGRNQPEVMSLIGMFVNTVLLRVDTGADPTFEALVSQVSETTLAAREHEALPFQQVAADLAGFTGPTAVPVPQVGFNHLHGTPLNHGYGTARDELTLEISGREGRIEYRTALFDATTVQSLTARYLQVLAAGGSSPATRISRLPVLLGSERERLLSLASGTGEPFGPADALVPDLILAQARRTPDAVAVRDAGTDLTYADVVGRAQALAARLTEAGAGPERLVAVLVPRSGNLIVAVLAVLLAGGGYLPLDPAQPAERLDFILADSGATIMIAGPGAAGPRGDLTVLTVEEPPAAEEPPGPAGVRPRTGATPARPGNVAYVIYTSGSTGRPKGVAIEHRSLAGYVGAFIRQCRLGRGDRILVSTPPSFDASVNELFPALITGGSLVIAPPSPGIDPQALLELVARQHVTVLPVVPAVLRELVGQAALERCAALGHVVCGGERLSAELARELADRLPVTLHNIYGPTETTVGVSAHSLPHPGGDTGDDAGRSTGNGTAAVPIGTPIAGARIYLLDHAGQLVPAGLPGHLHVGGPAVGRGYPGRPGLTADRFVPDPFGPPGSRLYRTGDLGRWDGDGRLHFLGRLDAQLKLRGMRIEPGEIEAVLLELPGVRQAIVRLHPSGDGTAEGSAQRLGDVVPQLVAYVQPAAGAELDPAALRAGLRRLLPESLVPASIVALAQVPLTATGKLDVSALPSPSESGAPQGPGRLPVTPAEILVAEIWAEVLDPAGDRPEIGVGDDFFALGGHSLLAWQVAIRLADVIEVEVPIHLVFGHPGLGELARALEGLLADSIGRLGDDEAERQLTDQTGRR